MDEGRLGELLAERCATYSVPGAQLGLLHGSERVVACAGTRAVDMGAPVERGTAFHAGSIAKSLTSLVVVDAARRGELDLDVPCDRQAPGLWDDTPRALMAQTTGRPNAIPELDEDIRHFVERIAAMPRVHAPGSFSYCNSGWPVLDLLLQHRSGATFEELASERVLGDATAFGQPPGSADGHSVRPGEPLVRVDSDMSSAASTAGSRWWVTADQLLEYARLHLDDGAGRFDAADVRELRRRHVDMPGATVSDAWGLGWAVWDRGDHRAFGWAGFTQGHRAYVRCFPEQSAALVLLTNSAGPLLGPPGGSSVLDALLPELLRLLEVPPLGPPQRSAGRETTALAGGFGPLTLTAGPGDSLTLDARAFGEPEPVELDRVGGNALVVRGDPPGAMTLAVVGDLLYFGPFAFPRNG